MANTKVKRRGRYSLLQGRRKSKRMKEEQKEEGGDITRANGAQRNKRKARAMDSRKATGERDLPLAPCGPASDLWQLPTRPPASPQEQQKEEKKERKERREQGREQEEAPEDTQAECLWEEVVALGALRAARNTACWLTSLPPPSSPSASSSLLSAEPPFRLWCVGGCSDAGTFPDVWALSPLPGLSAAPSACPA